MPNKMPFRNTINNLIKQTTYPITTNPMVSNTFYVLNYLRFLLQNIIFNDTKNANAWYKFLLAIPVITFKCRINIYGRIMSAHKIVVSFQS